MFEARAKWKEETSTSLRLILIWPTADTDCLLLSSGRTWPRTNLLHSCPLQLSIPAIVIGVYASSGCVYVLSAFWCPLCLFAPARPVLRHTRMNPYPCAKNPYPQRVHTRGKRVRTRCGYGYGYTETTRGLPVACPTHRLGWSERNTTPRRVVVSENRYERLQPVGLVRGVVNCRGSNKRELLHPSITTIMTHAVCLSNC